MGDILVDAAHNVYSIVALGRVLQVVKYRSDGVKLYEKSFGSASTPVVNGDEFKTVIS
jgi:hypothetical protein